MAMEAGTPLTHCQITGKLGAGGMGEVYRARDTKLDRDVAIKVLPENLSQDSERLARFEREAKAVAALSHPNILAIHDFGNEEGVTFMSPEQVRGEPADPRSDIFSFGAMLYELVTGERVFARDSAAETMIAILKEDPPRLSESGGHLPGVLERIIRHCLEKNPDERFQSAHDLAFALDAITQPSGTGTELGVTALPGSAPRRVSVPVAGLTTVVTLLVGLLAGWAIFRPSPVEPLRFERLTFRRGWITSAPWPSSTMRSHSRRRPS